MARLTDQEKQDIVRYLEADKPLPEKYRFLLFEEKREVELVWNGKTSEVCNIVGKPISMMLVQKAKGANATVTMCHTGTNDAHAQYLKGSPIGKWMI